MLSAAGVVRNVMSSQDVVNFVRQRIQSGVTQLSAICEEVARNSALFQNFEFLLLLQLYVG